MPETQIIFMSSNYIYSGLDSKDVVEEEIENISTHDFGLSKRFFEELLLRNHPNSVILRLSNVYGGSNQRNKTVLLEWKDAVLSNSEIVLWGKGLRKMQYVYIDDVVKIIMFGFSMKPGVYNMGSNEYLSMSEAAKILARIYGTNIAYLTDKKERMSLPLMKTQKIRKQIKNFNFTKFEQGISEYIGVKEQEFGSGSSGNV